MAKYQEILDAVHKLAEGFGRIDERTRNIWRLVEALEKHVAELNGTTQSTISKLDILKTQVEERTVSPIAHKMSKKAIGGYGGIALTIVTLVFYLGQAQGWW